MLGRTLAIAIFAVLAFVVRELRLRAFSLHHENQHYEDIYYLPPPQFLSVLSMGFRDALADLIWCRSLVYFGEEMSRQSTVKHAFDYVDAVLTLSPDFRSAYAWAATVAVYRPVTPNVEDGMRGLTYLERALKRWPNDGELHWDYGSMLRFEVAPLLPKGPEKDRLLAMAAPHLATAASLGAGPAWLAINSSSLMERLGQNEQAIRHLEEVYGTVQDEKVKRVIEERLASLRSQAFVEALKAANQKIEASRRKSYPYLTPGLFFFVGEREHERWAQTLANRYLPPTPTEQADQPLDDEQTN